MRGLDYLGIGCLDLPIALPKAPRTTDDIGPASPINVINHALSEQIAALNFAVDADFNSGEIDFDQKLIARNGVCRAVMLDNVEL